MPNMSDKDLLHGIYQAVNLYYNYTGKTSCLNLSSKATPDLGTMGWDYQVGHTLREHYTAGNRHKQNNWFCKEIREDNFRLWWRRVHKDASQGMYMSKIEIFFFTARILQNQRMLCCGECFHD
jgi:lysosomal Pro-X carboxypeptidase